MPLSKQRDRDRKRQSRLETENVQPKPYNPYTSRPGDRVLVRQGGQLIEALVPELDAEGNAIPE